MKNNDSKKRKAHVNTSSIGSLSTNFSEFSDPPLMAKLQLNGKPIEYFLILELMKLFLLKAFGNVLVV